MKKTIISSLLLAAFAFAISCKKSADPTPTRTDLLSSKSWIVTAGSVTPAFDIFGDGKPINGDYFTKESKCIQDDIFIFGSTGAYTHDEGATKCAASDPQIYSKGTWKFDTNETTITLNEDGDIRTWTVNELTATSLKVTEYYTDSGKKYTFDYSFGH